VTPPHAAPCQSFSMPTKKVFNIFDADKIVYTSYQVEEWVNLGKKAHDKAVRLKSPLHALVMHLTNWQIGYLERHNRIIPVGATEASGTDGPTPGYGLTLTPEKKAKADRILLYIDAVFAAYAKYCKGGHSRKVMERAVEELARQREEKPPALSGLYDKLSRLRTDGGFDPVAAVADRPRPGYRGKRTLERAEQALSEAIEETVSIGGTWDHAKSILLGWSRPGCEYADMPNLVTGEEPLLRDRTIQRRLGDVDPYTRDGLRYGYEYAERAHATRITQIRPMFALDIVDVDHSTMPIWVFGEGISFGRPDLIVFRDRFSGIILGWSISFRHRGLLGFPKLH
jgi:putative transposase